MSRSPSNFAHSVQACLTNAAMVELGAFNSRMKDFYDVWWLGQHRSFDGSVLAEAITATFERQGTPLPEETPVAVTPDFVTKRTRAQ